MTQYQYQNQYQNQYILPSVQQKLDYFYFNKKIPHILFHGPNGSGKRTIVHNFLNKIYNYDKINIKSNIMFVNCAHGKGIKFIREELKFFAKTNIQFTNNVPFKTIVLLNADFLTIDAQSALRRCIELFSFNTRFFIIVENKHKLLNPMLSRFCEIYVNDIIDENTKEHINLHQCTLNKNYNMYDYKKKKIEDLEERMQFIENLDHNYLVKKSEELYEYGYSCLDIIEWMKNDSRFSEKEKSAISLVFYKIKSEYRCEKLLMFYMFDYIFLRENKGVENIGFL